MTGGQDAAAAVRRLLLSAAMRSSPIRDAVAANATPPLRTGALRHSPGLFGPPRMLRVGALVPNPLLCLANGKQVRLDEIVDGAPAVLTARRAEPVLIEWCLRHGVVPVRVIDDPTAEPADVGWVDVRLAPGRSTRLQALVDDPSLTVLVRPDRVIAAVATGSKLPVLPWTIP
jgi:3-(3-hydroxy-phenyl)propionate hydroxylase